MCCSSWSHRISLFYNVSKVNILFTHWFLFVRLSIQHFISALLGSRPKPLLVVVDGSLENRWIFFIYKKIQVSSTILTITVGIDLRSSSKRLWGILLFKKKKKLIIQSLVLEKPALPLLLIIIHNWHPDQKLLWRDDFFISVVSWDSALTKASGKRLGDEAQMTVAHCCCTPEEAMTTLNHLPW